MGDIRRMNVAKWVAQYKLERFVETGVDQGAAIIGLMHQPFRRLLSIEIHLQQCERAAVNIDNAWPGQPSR